MFSSFCRCLFLTLSFVTSIAYAQPVTITTTAVPDGSVGVLYSFTFSASGGNGIYTWAQVAGSVGPGLHFQSDGSLSGTPNLVGSSGFTVQVLSGSGLSQTSDLKNFTITISSTGPVLTIQNPLPSATVGVFYTYTMTATGQGPFLWAATAGVPPGLSLSSAGVLSGTPTQPGNYGFTLDVQDSRPVHTLKTVSISVSSGNVPVITTTALPPGAVGQPYLFQFQASGGAPPYRWVLLSGLTNQLPPGITFSSQGVLSGTPTVSGSFSPSFQATDNNGIASIIRQFTLTVNGSSTNLTITNPTTLPAAQVSVPYSYQFIASGGVPTYIYALYQASPFSPPTLPAGLTLNTNGLLSGTPTVATTSPFSFSVQITDQTGASINQPFTITVKPPPIAITTDANLPPATVGVPYLLQFTAAGGAPAYAWSALPSTLPQGIFLGPTGVLNGTPTAAGTFNFTVTATDSVNGIGTKIFTLVVNATPVQPVQFSCTQQTSVLPPQRLEGLADLSADIVLKCVGGTPTATGVIVPQYALSATIPNLASRIVASPANTEILVLLDEPPPNAQSVCSAAPCNVTGTGTGVNVYTGFSGRPNVYQAQLSAGNQITASIPLDPPGQGSRTIRITNVRTSSTAAPTITLSNSTVGSVPINATQPPTAAQQAGLNFSLKTAAGGAFAGFSIQQPIPLNPTVTPGSQATALLSFTEGFPSAFRSRGSSGSQNLIGSQYNTESGFWSLLFPPSNGLNNAGLADSGTRLIATFTNVPAGISLYVEVTDRSGSARLTTSDAQGGGPFGARQASVGNWAQVDIQNGSGRAVWEVQKSDPNSIETFDIGVLISTGSAGNQPAGGSATVTGNLGPISTVTGPDANAPLPRFRDISTPRVLFTVAGLPQFAILPAASFAIGGPVAPNAFAEGFSPPLGITPVSSNSPFPTSLGGVRVEVVDSQGVNRLAGIYSVGGGLIQFVVPSGTARGTASVTVFLNNQPFAFGAVPVELVSPGIFSYDGSGTGLAVVQVVRLRDGVQTVETPGTAPISMGPDTDVVALQFYGTGIRNHTAGLDNVIVRIGGAVMQVLYADRQPSVDGLDQIDVLLPRSLAGAGTVDLQVTIDGRSANKLTLQFQ